MPKLSLSLRRYVRRPHFYTPLPSITIWPHGLEIYEGRNVYFSMLLMVMLLTFAKGWAVWNDTWENDVTWKGTWFLTIVTSTNTHQYSFLKSMYQVAVACGWMWVNTAKLPGLTYTVKIHCVLMSYSLSIWLNDTVMIDNRPKASFYQNWWLFSLTIKLHIIWQGWVMHVPDLVISSLSRQTWKAKCSPTKKQKRSESTVLTVHQAKLSL